MKGRKGSFQPLTPEFHEQLRSFAYNLGQGWERQIVKVRHESRGAFTAPARLQLPSICRPWACFGIVSDRARRRAGRSPLGLLGMTHLKNNEAPANDRGCVADVSHIS